MDCSAITPITAFQSTNLNSKIDSFKRLGERISRTLGAPLVNLEVHHDQLFENISIACEMFAKFAGYTEEILVFDSDLYNLLLFREAPPCIFLLLSIFIFSEGFLQSTSKKFPYLNFNLPYSSIIFVPILE